MKLTYHLTVKFVVKFFCSCYLFKHVTLCHCISYKMKFLCAKSLGNTLPKIPGYKNGIFPWYSWFENVHVYNFICWENYSKNVSRIKHILLSNTLHIFLFVLLYESVVILRFNVQYESYTVAAWQYAIIYIYVKSGYSIRSMLNISMFARSYPVTSVTNKSIK